MCTCKVRKVGVKGEKPPRQRVSRCRMAVAEPSWRVEGQVAVEGGGSPGQPQPSGLYFRFHPKD